MFGYLQIFDSSAECTAALQYAIWTSIAALAVPRGTAVANEPMVAALM
jgi:hypothetical protein